MTDSHYCDSRPFCDEKDEELTALKALNAELVAALTAITNHFAAVMGGPFVTGAGVRFVNGVEGIPTIARARAALKNAAPAVPGIHERSAEAPCQEDGGSAGPGAVDTPTHGGTDVSGGA